MEDEAAATDDEMRSRILDAADACISRYGVQKTTIEDVAKRAGVARATLYKYVPGGRDELVLAVIVREAERNVGTVIEAMQQATTIEDALTAGILASVDRIQADEHLFYLFSPEILGTASRLPAAGLTLVEATARVLHPFLEAGRQQGVIHAGLTDRDIADWSLRIIASLLWFEGVHRDRDELTAFVRQFAVRPLLEAPQSARTGTS